jgi:phytoene desaturase
MSKPTALVIGAGVGGLATAIHLARRNFDVIVLEKNQKPGGRCNQITKDGHCFDTGPTFYIFPELYEAMFTALGENINDHIKLIRIDPSHRIFFHDNSSIQLTSDLALMRNQLEDFEPRSYSRFLSYLNKTQLYYEPVLRQIITKDFSHPQDYFNFGNLKLLLQAKGWQNHCSYLGKFFHDQRLKDAFVFQDSYIGLNPHRTSSLFSIFSVSELTKGVWLPKGGMYQVVKALLKIASKYGVKIRCGLPVEKIVTEGSRVKKIICGDGRSYTADIVVANTDLAYTCRQLLPYDDFGKRINKKRFSCSTISFFWGLKKIYPAIKTHNIFLTKDSFDGYDRVINKHLIPEKPHFYVHAPARTDLSLAPSGQDTITAIIPVGHLTNASPKKWRAIKQKIRRYIFKRLYDIGITDFEKQIKFELSFSPVDWLNEYNLTHGATLGIHHDLLQMGYLRPGRRHPRYKNLYFTGSNTHPGSGVPTVLLSSHFTANAILSDSNYR